LGGPATLVEIAADGTAVKQGDVIARFDSSQWERDLLRLERDYTVAREDFSGLSHAKLPLEEREMEMRVADARREHANEMATFADSRELQKESLVSEEEVRQQEIRVSLAAARLESLEQERDLTRQYLHPAAMERARAALSSALQELHLARAQVSNCAARAPCDGIAACQPLALSGEFRPARVGDTLFKNQVFMTVSDMEDLVFRCEVPEAELNRIRPGAEAVVRVLAFPDMTLTGQVESIGAAARTVMGRANSQKFFSMAVRMGSADRRLRSGMSAQGRILSYSNPRAALIPRAAVWWEDDQAFCNRWSGSSGGVKTAVRIGMADETRFEALDGVRPGDRVVIR
jgi:HlyD family secretion protein